MKYACIYLKYTDTFYKNSCFFLVHIIVDNYLDDSHRRALLSLNPSWTFSFFAKRVVLLSNLR